MPNPADPEYRTNQKKLRYCIDCGADPGEDTKRCISCKVTGRKNRVSRMKAVVLVLAALIAWAILTAFGTVTGHLIDMTDGKVGGLAQGFGGVCFFGGFIVGGCIVAVTVIRWVKQTTPKQ